MKERLEIIVDRYNFLCEEILKPEIYEDYKKMQEISKEKNSLEKTVETYKKYNTVLDDIVVEEEKDEDDDDLEEEENYYDELDTIDDDKEEDDLKDLVIVDEGYEDDIDM